MKNRWISINESVPEESCQVLGVMKDTLDQYICFFKKSRNIFLVYGAGVDPISDMKVTHWMHLSSPPNVKDILLTEEWLIKLGFRKEHDEPFNWSDRKKYLQDCFLIGNYSDGLHYVRNGMKTGKALVYVHQLQNLYFALTGEELTIQSYH